MKPNVDDDKLLILIYIYCYMASVFHFYSVLFPNLQIRELFTSKLGRRSRHYSTRKFNLYGQDIWFYARNHVNL